MKAVKITELDSMTDFPVGYVVKSDGSEEMVGCCPKAFFNFFGLLGVIEELNSEFLFWLKAELKEDDKTLLTPHLGIKEFFRNTIFERIDCSGGLIYNHSATDYIYHLADGWIMLTLLIHQGLDNPSHCEVYYMTEGKLFCNGVEISAQTFAQKIFCHEKNHFIIGKRKG